MNKKTADAPRQFRREKGATAPQRRRTDAFILF
jgi:hypothetical protein